jgi:formylglycine-generating enzyme required for sulfatase activity
MRKMLLNFVLPLALLLRVSAAAPAASDAQPGMALIPAGTCEMGDHHGFVGPNTVATRAHAVRLDAFRMGIYTVTTKEYCDFLNLALARQQIEIHDCGVFLVGGGLFRETWAMSPYSRTDWEGWRFTVLDRKENHPVVWIRWPGAAGKSVVLQHDPNGTAISARVGVGCLRKQSGNTPGAEA